MKNLWSEFKAFAAGGNMIDLAIGVIIGVAFGAVVESLADDLIGGFIGANKGLGYFILYAGQTFDSASLFAGIIILVSLVFLANQVLGLIEARVLSWQPRHQEVHVQV